MLWIILVIAAGLGVGWLIVTYGYRHSILIALVVLAAGIGVLAWYVRFGDQPGTGLITPQEVQLNNMQMTREYRSSYQMAGRLVNDSKKFTLVSVKITITASDCKSGGADCIVVGEDHRSVSVEIPPGQARDVVEEYMFPRFVLQGQLKWRYRLSEIKATSP